jgi:hypothetical protein
MGVFASPLLMAAGVATKSGWRRFRRPTDMGTVWRRDNGRLHAGHVKLCTVASDNPQVVTYLSRWLLA